MSNQFTRVLIDADPFIAANAGLDWRQTGLWPCRWVALADAPPAPFVAAYRLRFTLDAPATFRAHVSGDERYALYVDGQLVGRGPERGAPYRWFYESFDCALDAGEHMIVAQVWSLGERAAIATTSVRHGFLFAPEGEWTTRLGTGHADWQAARLDGYSFLDPAPCHWRESPVQIDGAAFPWGFERGDGDGWTPVVALHPGIGRWVDWEFHRQHLLAPAMLPPQLSQPVRGGRVRHIDAPDSADTHLLTVESSRHLADEADAWGAWLNGTGTVTIPPHSQRRVIIDLDEYYCAYPEVVTSGGAGSQVRARWAEALHVAPVWGAHKGHRDVIEGKYLSGRRDIFLPDGGAGRGFRPLWWQAGRYVEIYAQTADAPLTLDRLTLTETRYPLNVECQFDADDRRLLDLLPILVRGMQVDLHETYADSPYYEELMYAGDTRLEIMMTYLMTHDDRPPRKAITLFDESRLPNGFTQSRYPARMPQVIAPFCVWWVGMIHDFALWRDDPAFVRRFMPGVRATLEAFGRWMGDDGLLRAPMGWNTLDWVEDWPAGIPPGGVPGEAVEVSGLLNWQLAYGLALAAKLERWFGAPELAARYERWAREIVAGLDAQFWDESRGLYADDLGHSSYSEHSQCMALLSDWLPAERARRVLDGLLSADDLHETTIYFSFYLFEVFQKYGRVSAMFDRLPLWFELVTNGLKCPIESPEPTRSDSHAWGAHPLYHYFTSILGIRPAEIGFRSVEVRPQLAALSRARGVIPHPGGGEIVVDLRVDGGVLHATVTLPPGVPGTFVYAGAQHPLPAGQTTALAL
jgi:hypothetical protein